MHTQKKEKLAAGEMVLSNTDAIKIYETAACYALKMRRHYHLTEDETEELASRLYERAAIVTAAKWTSERTASPATYGSTVCRLECYNLGRAIKRERKLSQLSTPIDAFIEDDGELTDNNEQAMLEDSRMRERFAAMIVRMDVATACERIPRTESEVIAALIRHDGNCTKAAEELNINEDNFRRRRATKAAKDFAQVYFN